MPLKSGAAVADQAIRDAVPVFVKHHVAVHRAVTVGVGRGEKILLHARALAIGRRGEVRIVRAGAILRFGPHGVVACAAASVVIGLEVARRLRESEA